MIKHLRSSEEAKDSLGKCAEDMLPPPSQMTSMWRCIASKILFFPQGSAFLIVWLPNTYNSLWICDESPFGHWNSLITLCRQEVTLSDNHCFDLRQELKGTFSISSCTVGDKNLCQVLSCVNTRSDMSEFWATWYDPFCQECVSVMRNAREENPLLFRHRANVVARHPPGGVFANCVSFDNLNDAVRFCIDGNSCISYEDFSAHLVNNLMRGNWHHVII